jgi:hypothetical protein
MSLLLLVVVAKRRPAARMVTMGGSVTCLLDHRKGNLVALCEAAGDQRVV